MDLKITSQNIGFSFNWVSSHNFYSIFRSEQCEQDELRLSLQNLFNFVSTREENNPIFDLENKLISKLSKETNQKKPQSKVQDRNSTKSYKSALLKVKNRLD